MLNTNFLFLVIDDLALAIEAIGVVAILVSLVRGLWPYVIAAFTPRPAPDIRVVRSRLGQGFILSLDILIAATLLRMVMSPSITEVAVLSVITMLRIMLALTLGYELREIEDVRAPKQTGASGSDEAA